MISRLLAFIILVLLSPVFVLIANIILIEDNAPVFYKQIRVGLNTTKFWIYKFRTMKRDTPELATHLLQNSNNYIFTTGKFLRKFSLDELPNLINIMKGEMVFVGPRPALHNQYDLIELRKEMGIDKLKPGITGWAQVNGRDEISLVDKVKYDKEYLERKSVLFDLKILLLTFRNSIQAKNIKH